MASERIEARGFGEIWQEKGFEFCLLPAGHIVGSAMIHLTRLSDGSSMLYTGDFKLRRGLTAEVAELRQADLLVMETTFGLPRYRFPSEREVRSSILQFVRGAFEENVSPVLLGYSLGKAQEVVAMLEEAEIPCLQHPTVAAMTTACRSVGVGLRSPSILEDEVPEGWAVVGPPRAVRSKVLRGIRRRRVAMLTGWAMNPGARYRYQVDEVFPLSDHADYPDLLRAVAEVAPRRVLTLHGSAREFAADLRRRGVEAWSVFGDDQLELLISSSTEEAAVLEYDRPGGGLCAFTDCCMSVEKVASRAAKIRSLVAYLRSLDESDLRRAGVWLSGRVFGRAHRHRSLQVGSSVVRQSLLDASGIPAARYRQVSAVQGDIARTTRILLEESSVSPRPMELSEIEGLLDRLAEAGGSMARVSVLAKGFAELHPLESASLVRIITGSLRMGSKEGVLEEAVAEAFGQSVEDVRKAHMLTGDLGSVAALAKADRLEEVRLLVMNPVRPMLASPESTAEGIWARHSGDGFVWLEEKHDGIRAQIHKLGREVAIFSRDLRRLDMEFPEILEALRGGEGDFILDGEIIAYEEGRRLTFFDLQRRLGRTTGQGDLFFGASVPVRFLAFDLMFTNGEDLLERPLSFRRELLEKMVFPEVVERIRVVRARSVLEIEDAFQAARRAGTEGLVVKRASSRYSPGRRGKNWLKLKGVMPTLDCVVIKAQQGHGRRAGVLSDYTFALRDETTGQLVTLGKAYSGLTDEEIEELTEIFKERSVAVSRRVHTVEPEVVLEIAFDFIRRSRRHDSGLALRFPRIKAIRRDKGPDDIDTLAYAESLLGKISSRG
ncbi:MAG: ATP-dependent DNA ligase [Verrucomicrobiales bacterium]